MNIVSDKDIPFVEHYFGSVGDITQVAGRDLTRDVLRHADIVLVRSITEVNKDLLEGTSVKWVASPTTGADHFDTVWLEKAGIEWSVAEGCNADAVADYVLSVIAVLQNRGYLMGEKPRAGIIGVGKIGSRIVEKLTCLGFKVVLCDPLREHEETNFVSTSIEDFKELDLITLHTPLTHSGSYPTYHLIEKTFLQRQKKHGFILNTARGAVVDSRAIKSMGQSLHWCLDVWENEPCLDAEIIKNAMIATPHIAGHTIQSKYRGIHMVYQKAIEKHIIPDHRIPMLPYPRKKLSFLGKKVTWRDVVLAVYDPSQATRWMKENITEPDATVFDALRKKAAADRYELHFVDIENVQLDPADQFLLEACTSIR